MHHSGSCAGMKQILSTILPLYSKTINNQTVYQNRIIVKHHPEQYFPLQK